MKLILWNYIQLLVIHYFIIELDIWIDKIDHLDNVEKMQNIHEKKKKL